MKHWAQGSGFQFSNSAACFGEEFAVPGAPLNIAVITVKGRYPDVGYMYNLEAHEMAYVASGRGSVELKGAETRQLQQGDVVYFAPNEKIAWQGDMLLIVPCGPAFDPEKHKEDRS